MHQHQQQRKQPQSLWPPRPKHIAQHNCRANAVTRYKGDGECVSQLAVQMSIKALMQSKPNVP